MEFPPSGDGSMTERTEAQRMEDNIERVAEFYTQHDQSDKQSSDSDLDEKEVCWICLEGGSEENPLVAPCKCPRKGHAKCLARWQLQSAGSKYGRSPCDGSCVVG